MRRPTLATSVVALTIALAAVVFPRPLGAQDLPQYLRDRGTGIRTSLLGSYVRHRELIVYPFFEWYADRNLEYKPVELSYGPSQLDYRGRYRASEGLLFFAYGLSPDVALEFEAAVITAELRTAANDTSSARPFAVKESGLGDVEAQIRWRFQRETQTQPEFFTFFSSVFPLQKSKHLIGTQDWEFSFGLGMVRGYPWGTLTVRTAGEYTRAERKFDFGEYAIEYLRRVSPSWKVIAAIEGVQVDEVALITEAQWQFHRHAILKLNNGWGITTNATDFAPEIGILFSF